MRKSRLSAVLGHILGTAAFAAAFTVCAGSASAVQYQLLHAFCQDGSCHDGRNPQDALIRDSDGNFFGTANVGGDTNHGAVFELKFNNSTRQYDYLILHSFCPVTCSDGAFPDAPLIMDTDGNLYGTTTQGGAANFGVVFKLVRGSKHYTLHVLHDFCTGSNCEDGTIPVSGLSYRGQQTGALFDGASPLYGSTERTDFLGDGSGVVYQLRGAFHTDYKVLHTFCLTDCADGQFPSSLTIDRHGHLLGIAETGGVRSHGLIFSLHPNTLELDVLYNFCSRTNCADGEDPDVRQRPVQDSTGALYGTAFDGGKHGMGTVWKFKPHGNGGKLTVLYNFCSQPSCADGAFPRAGVTLGSGGEVFGETPQGGTCDVSGGCGVVFELQTSTYTLLHSFCADGDPCPTDGAQPFGGLVLDPSGTLFGVTAYGGGGSGGLIDGGTAFSVKP